MGLCPNACGRLLSYYITSRMTNDLLAETSQPASKSLISNPLETHYLKGEARQKRVSSLFLSALPSSQYFSLNCQ